MADSVLFLFIGGWLFHALAEAIFRCLIVRIIPQSGVAIKNGMSVGKIK
jgi:hypothetical protein